MARQIVVLDIVVEPGSLAPYHVDGVFWLVAPAGRVRPVPAFTSAVPLDTVVPWGVSATELAALRAGTLVEQSFSSDQQPNGTGVAAAEVSLLASFAIAQAKLTATAL